MKRIFERIAAIALFATMIISCIKTDFSEGRIDQVNGLLNLVVRIPGSSTEYTPEKKGPYAEGEEIIIKLPTSEDNPTDVTALYMVASLEHNCYINPPLGDVIDFTEPYQIEVTDVKGVVHHNTVRIVLIPPKVKVQELWTKNCVDLGIASRNVTGLALTDKYLAVSEWGDNNDAKFRLYDKNAGSLIKTLENPWTFIMKCESDDAGHLLVCRENIYGAGFIVYLYDDENEKYIPILDYKAIDGCPVDLGYSFTVIGDVTKGKAYIYSVPRNSMTFYYWEMLDGKLLTPEAEPKTLRYGPAKSEWNFGTIQRASLDDDSEHYISFFRHDKGLFAPNPEKEKEALEAGYGSFFHVFDKDMNIVELNRKNSLYKILDFKVFEVGNDRYLVTNEQEYLDWGVCKIRLYEITDYNRLELSPGDSGYNKFKIWESDCTVPTNYNWWGDIDIHTVPTPSGFDVYIASSTVGFSLEETKIRMFKMTYLNQN